MCDICKRKGEEKWFVCSSCVQELLNSSEEELSKRYNTALRAGYNSEARAIKSFWGDKVKEEALLIQDPLLKHNYENILKMKTCPKFNECNVPICPLDVDKKLRVYLSGEEVCKLSKIKIRKLEEVVNGKVSTVSRSINRGRGNRISRTNKRATKRIA